MKGARLITQKEKEKLAKKIEGDIKAFSRSALARGRRFNSKKRKGLY